MSTILYTSPAEVLGSIGIADIDEFPDSLFMESGVEDDLAVELSALVPAHADLAAQVDAGSATAEQVAEFTLIKLFCKWYVAVWAADSALVFEKDTGDGKAMAKRFERALQQTQEKAQRYMAKYREMILELQDSTVTSAPQLVGVSVSSYNPVTNT